MNTSVEACAIPSLLAAMVLSIGSATACDVIKDPRPTWEQMIDDADVVFVGIVTDTAAESDAGWGRARFDVQTWGKGGQGAVIESGQGSGSDCVLEFSLGSRVIYAGHWVDGILLADDTGWDPTVFLDDPPTPDQQQKLDYVNNLAEKQAAAGATK